jgi:choline dehydrogenase-like flavoprotein
MTAALVVGSGAGGAVVAKELQGAFEVTVVEAGKEFRPFRWPLERLERLRSTGLLLDEREIRVFFPPMRVRKTSGGMVLVNGITVGGTTTIATGNALRVDADLKAVGIDLDLEFDELSREIAITTAHERGWREVTRELFAACADLGLEPQPTPKMGVHERCAHCGRCVLGCPLDVKWDSRRFVDEAVAQGARLLTGCRVERLVIRGGRAIGVEARAGLHRRFLPADVVILAAGGLGTPAILQRSGIPCEQRLAVDPVLCVAARRPGSSHCQEVAMPFIVQGDGYIVSPYFDYLSFFFNRSWRHPARDIVSLMVKIADSSVGGLSDGRIRKDLTGEDRKRLDDGVRLCRIILGRLGIPAEKTFLGTLNAGHPGGMLPLTAREAGSMHHDRLPANVYVADASLLPRSLGNPPSLTIMALAKRVAKTCIQNLGDGSPAT